MNNVDIDKLESVYNSLIDMLKNMGEENSHVSEELVKIEEFKNFRHSLGEESDRGSALMAAAFIEEKIGELLQLFCIDNKKIYTRLFENTGALATFSSKIDLAFLLGIIPKNIFDDLHLLRRIRNDFAHTASHITFESSPIKERCYSFSVLVKMQLRDHPRAYFLRAMTVILTFISRQPQNLNKCTMVENFNTDTIEQMMRTVNRHIQKN